MKNRSTLVRQSGVILFIALVILVFMSMAGVALMRTIDVGNDIAGNFATRQASLTASDRGIEQASGWLTTNQGDQTTANLTLLTDNVANGYAAKRRLDGAGNDVNFFSDATWANAPVAKMPNVASETDSLGNRVQYLIDRQCARTGQLGSQAGNANGNTDGQYNYCLNSVPASLAGTGDCKPGFPCDTSGVSVDVAPNLTYYRVVVRTTGLRNAVSYVQALVAQQVPANSGGQ